MVTNRITINPDGMILTESVRIITYEGISLSIPNALLPAFKELVSRGINTWDQAPQEIKDFVDELTGNDKLLGMKVVINPTLAPNEFRMVKNCGAGSNAQFCDYPHCNCPRN